MNNEVDVWFRSLSEHQHLLLVQLRQLILETDSRFTEELKWGQPCYSINRLVCYLQKAKGHVAIGFQHGSRLADANNLLVGEGRDMRHVKFSFSGEIDSASVSNLIAEAVKHDEPYGAS